MSLTLIPRSIRIPFHLVKSTNQCFQPYLQTVTAVLIQSIIIMSQTLGGRYNIKHLDKLMDKTFYYQQVYVSKSCTFQSHSPVRWRGQVGFIAAIPAIQIFFSFPRFFLFFSPLLFLLFNIFYWGYFLTWDIWNAKVIKKYLQGHTTRECSHALVIFLTMIDTYSAYILLQ